MNSALNNLNLDNFNLKELTILLEVFNSIKIETKPVEDDIEVI